MAHRRNTPASTRCGTSMRRCASIGAKMGGLGPPPKSVQERMGHSTIALTMDTCSHLFPANDHADKWQQPKQRFLPDATQV